MPTGAGRRAPVEIQLFPYVIHPASIAVSREHRRAKTDRLDTELLIRVFLGWLRGEKRHCSMVATRVTALRPG